MLGILALESERNRCLIIGEDLGTVPDAVRAAMAEFGLLAYRPMYFERTGHGEFKPPPEYMRDAVAVITTHDLPTLRVTGWPAIWRRDPISVFFPTVMGVSANTMIVPATRHRLLAALQRETLLPAGMSPEMAGTLAMDETLVRAVHAFVARAPSKILMVQLEDVLGQIEQVNVPGTTDERYPNWRRKLPVGPGGLDKGRGSRSAAGISCAMSAAPKCVIRDW
jgi:(1->4)-alpha-D-glucan 1-alpha-D-glucosylmutase